jgi:hypothetical protein
MAQAAKAQEPSMEEILASIRRIIADDEAKPPTPAAVRPAPPPAPEAVAPPPPPPEPEPPPSEPEIAAESAIEEPAPAVLDLTEDMTAGEEALAFQTVAAEPDIVFAEAEPEPEPEPEPQESAPESPPPIREDRLLSGSTTAAVDAAFSSLAHTILLNNPRTLEDLVREMLRPMLKSWLDDNLPGLVERLVRAEIERVSRGR